MNYTICGAGIAGLYTAYKILVANPDAKIIIYEKNKYIAAPLSHWVHFCFNVVFRALPIGMHGNCIRKRRC